jgi:hypothetical protein
MKNEKVLLSQFLKERRVFDQFKYYSKVYFNDEFYTDLKDYPISSAFQWNKVNDFELWEALHEEWMLLPNKFNDMMWLFDEIIEYRKQLDASMKKAVEDVLTIDNEGFTAYYKLTTDYVQIPIDLYNKLNYLGLIPNETRESHVGASNYSNHFIQPWSIWLDYPELTSFDHDIIKRVLRTKGTDSRKMDYEKIIHICQERIRQIGVENVEI